jgi:hypothetical protein
VAKNRVGIHVTRICCFYILILCILLHDLIDLLQQFHETSLLAQLSGAMAPSVPRPLGQAKQFCSLNVDRRDAVECTHKTGLDLAQCSTGVPTSE